MQITWCMLYYRHTHVHLFCKSYFWCRTIVRSSHQMYWMVFARGRTHSMPHWNPIMMDASKNRVLLDFRQKQTSNPQTHLNAFHLFLVSSISLTSSLHSPYLVFTLLSSTSLPAIVCFIPSWFPLSRSLAPSMCFFSVCLPSFFSTAFSDTHC